MLDAVYEEMPDMILFLGDGVRDLYALRDTFADIPVRLVAGNCDVGSFEAERDFFEVAGKKIMMLHGHQYGVKYGTEKIVNMACCAGADILLFGHTHRPLHVDVNGLLVINPGSLGYDGLYGKLMISGGSVTYEAKCV